MTCREFFWKGVCNTRSENDDDGDDDNDEGHCVSRKKVSVLIYYLGNKLVVGFSSGEQK